eukprot:206468_1
MRTPFVRLAQFAMAALAIKWSLDCIQSRAPTNIGDSEFYKRWMMFQNRLTGKTSSNDTVLTVIPQSPARFIEALVRETIIFPTGYEYQDTMFNEFNFNPSHIHALKHGHTTVTTPKNMLFIIEPAGLFLDPQAITTLPSNTSMDQTLLAQTVRAYNKNGLRFGLGWNESDSTNVYTAHAYNPQLMMFISWLHRLSKSFNVAFDLIAYSDVISPVHLLYHLNVIQTYYNVIERECTNTSEWFTFAAGVTAQSGLKSLQDIRDLLPGNKSYDLVMAVDTDGGKWSTISEVKSNEIGVLVQPYQYQNPTKSGVKKTRFNTDDSSGQYLAALKQLVTNIVAVQSQREALMKTMTDRTAFWNTLALSGKFKVYNTLL